jgi:hypothetical protein
VSRREPQPRPPHAAERLLHAARKTYLTRWASWLRSLDDHPPEDAEEGRWRLDDLRGEVEFMRSYLDGFEADIARLARDLGQREKLRQLREGVNGRTEAEVQTARRLADRLEARR